MSSSEAPDNIVRFYPNFSFPNTFS